jgi:hypothetical protein
VLDWNPKEDSPKRPVRGLQKGKPLKVESNKEAAKNSQGLESFNLLAS